MKRRAFVTGLAASVVTGRQALCAPVRLVVTEPQTAAEFLEWQRRNYLLRRHVFRLSNEDDRPGEIPQYLRHSRLCAKARIMRSQMREKGLSEEEIECIDRAACILAGDDDGTSRDMFRNSTRTELLTVLI